MKYILVASLLSSAVFAAPFAQQGNGRQNGQQGQNAQQGQNGQNGQNGQQGQTGATNVNTGGAATQGTPSSGDLATAVSNWQADTSMVSNFLDTGAGIQNNAQFKQAALVAFNAEVDELNHKAIIDSANANMPQVQSANSTLATGGAFQDVVDKLQEMSVKGRAAVTNIDLINQNRCVNVLPNIDAYMASTGSASQAIRPQVCNQTGVQGGVQGNGPTLPGDAAGTPQAAFTAAQALASGQGNGIVDNNANGIPAAQAAAQAGNPAPQAGGAAQQQQGGAAQQQQGGAAAQQGGAAQQQQGQQAAQGAQGGNAAGQQQQQGAQTGAQGASQGGASQGAQRGQGNNN